MTVNPYRVLDLVYALKETVSTNKQTTGTLMRIAAQDGASENRQPGACCLGKACVVAQYAGLKIDVRVSGDKLEFDGEQSALPPSVRDWFGFDLTDPYLLEASDGVNHDAVNPHTGTNRDGTFWEEPYPGDTYNMKASLANDDLGLTFSQIGDLFRWQYASKAAVEAWDLAFDDNGVPHGTV